LATLSLGGLVAIVVVGLYRSRPDSIQRDPSDDGLAAFCGRHRIENAAVLERGSFEGGSDARSALLSFCALGRSTAWTVAFSGDAGLGLDVVVLGADRSERRFSPRFGAGPVTFDALSATSGDVDGDGEPEVLVHRISSLGAESVLLTARNGVIREYTDLPAGALDDVDGDGRMDVLTPGPYGRGLGSTAWSWITWEHFVAHVGTDGVLRLDDAVAKAHLLKRCPERPTRFWEGDHGLSELGPQIVCARAWGVSAEAVSAQFGVECKKWGPPSAFCSPAIALMVAIEPPLRLP